MDNNMREFDEIFIRKVIMEIMHREYPEINLSSREDICQNVIISIWMSHVKGQIKEIRFGLIKRAVLQKVIDYKRSPINKNSSDNIDQLVDILSNEDFNGHIKMFEIMDLLDNISEEAKTIILLAARGYTEKEIADRMRISIFRVRQVRTNTTNLIEAQLRDDDE